LDGLADAPKSGRTPKINAAIKTYLHEMLQNPSPNMKALVLDELKKRHPHNLGQHPPRPAKSGLLLPPRPAGDA